MIIEFLWFVVAVVLVALVQQAYWTLEFATPGDHPPQPQRHRPAPSTSSSTSSSSSSANVRPTRATTAASQSTRRETTTPIRSVHTQTTDFTPDGRMAIVSIAIGEKARYFARYLLVSYMRNSQFGGPLYLITDEPSYFDNMKEEQRLHPHSELRFIDVDFDHETGGGTVGHLQLPIIPDEIQVRENKYGMIIWAQFSDYKRGRLQIKWLKSKVFELIPPEFEYLIFMDSDIFIGQDLRPFADLSMRALAPPQMLALFTDIGHTGSDYHTGVVVLSRQRSPPLVEQWGANIMSGEHGSDQRAIGAAIAAMNISERISLLPVEERHGFFTFVHGKLFDSKKPFTFIHATFYRLTTGEKFGFTNRTAKRYIEETLNTPWEPWTGKDIPVVPRYCEPLAGTGKTLKDLKREKRRRDQENKIASQNAKERDDNAV